MARWPGWRSGIGGRDLGGWVRQRTWAPRHCHATFSSVRSRGKTEQHVGPTLFLPASTKASRTHRRCLYRPRLGDCISIASDRSQPTRVPNSGPRSLVFTSRTGGGDREIRVESAANARRIAKSDVGSQVARLALIVLCGGTAGALFAAHWESTLSLFGGRSSGSQLGTPLQSAAPQRASTQSVLVRFGGLALPNRRSGVALTRCVL